MDLCSEGFEGSSDVDASLERGEKKKEEHLFTDGKGGDVGWSDGGETFGREAHIACPFMEE